MHSLENAIVRLLKTKPFYGHLLLNLRRETITKSDRCAGITIRHGVPVLSIAEQQFSSLEQSQQEGLLEHLIKHLLHLHMLRRRERNPHDWDVACDLAINHSIESLPGGALYPENYGMEPGLAAEEYYAMITRPMETGNCDGAGAGSASQDVSGATGAGNGTAAQQADTIDCHDDWQDADSTPFPLAEEMIRNIVRESLRGSDGDTPSDVRELINSLLQPAPIPWRQVLRQFVATAGRTGRSTTWMREHRRFVHETPGVRKRRRLSLLVGIDVSDSTNIVELRQAFASELMQIAKGRECQITVLYSNSRIQKIEEFCNSSFVSHQYDGGGFTDLRPVFEYAHGMHPAPAAVIYLTDGIGPVPEQMEYPTLWVLTSDGERPAPWGVELRLTV